MGEGEKAAAMWLQRPNSAKTGQTLVCLSESKWTGGIYKTPFSQTERVCERLNVMICVSEAPEVCVIPGKWNSACVTSCFYTFFFFFLNML